MPISRLCGAVFVVAAAMSVTAASAIAQPAARDGASRDLESVREGLRRSGAADTTDLALESVLPVSRSKTVFVYRCVIKNVGSVAVAEKDVIVQAYWSDHAAIDDNRTPKQGAGGRPVGARGVIQPGETRVYEYPATVKTQPFRYLHVELRTQPREANPSDNRQAIALQDLPDEFPRRLPPLVQKPAVDSSAPDDAGIPMPQIAPRPSAKLQQPAKAQVAAPKDKVAKTVARPPPARTKGAAPVRKPPPVPQQSFLQRYFRILFASFVLLNVIIAATVLRRAGKGGPARFGQVDDEDRIDPEEARKGAEELEFRVIEEPPLRVQAAVELFFGKAEITSLFQKAVPGGLYSLCNVQVTRVSTSSSRGGRSTRHVYRHTALLFEGRDDVRFPQFGTQPVQHGALYQVVKLLSGAGKPHFPEDPEFHRRLLVGAVDAEATRALLTPAVREVLKQHSRFIVSANDDCAIVYEWGDQFRRSSVWSANRMTVLSGQVAVAEWAHFVNPAFEILESLRRSESITRHTRPETAVPGGLSRSELEAWFATPAPRPLFPALRQSVRPPADIFLRIWSIVMGTMAAVVGVLFMMASPLIGSIVLSVGLSLASIWPLYRWVSAYRKRRFLREGRLVSARIGEIQSTQGAFVNGSDYRRGYWVTFDFDLDGKRHEVRQKIYGAAAYRLSRLHRQARSTRVLVDPQRSDKLWWVDGLVPEN